MPRELAPKRCAVCVSTTLAEIDRALSGRSTTKETYQAIADRFGIAKYSIVNHDKRCLAGAGKTDKLARGPGRCCRCCVSPLRTEIERRLARGGIEGRYKNLERWTETQGDKISDSGIRKHALDCVPRCLETAGDVAAQQDAITVDVVTAALNEVLVEARAALDAVRQDSGAEHVDRARAIDQLRKAVESLAKVAQVMTDRIEIRIAEDPKYQRAMQLVLEAVATPGGMTGADLCEQLAKRLRSEGCL